MNKFIKLLSRCLLAGIGIGISVYAFKKYFSHEHTEDDIFEEDDFDLGNDLQPVKEREYVSLKRDENL